MLAHCDGRRGDVTLKVDWRARLLALVLAGPLARAEIFTWEYARDDVDSTYLAAPTGYYYDPATARWYYYDGVFVSPQEAGFTPPPGAGWTFELQPSATSTAEGFILTINMKLIGAHTLHYLIEYEFGVEDRRLCPDPTRVPVCIEEGDRLSRNFLVGPTVISTIERTIEIRMAAPNVGTAEAWGWLDATTYDKASATVHAPSITW